MRSSLFRFWVWPSQASTAPVFTVAPSISGTGLIGQALTLNIGTVTGASSVSWELARGATVVASGTADGQQYTPVDADDTSTLVLTVTAVGAGGARIATASIAIRYQAPTFLSQPVFNPGAYSSGDLITLQSGSVDTPATLTMHFLLESVDKTPELSNSVFDEAGGTATWDSTGEAAGTMEFYVVAQNSGGIVTTDTISVELFAAASAPGVMAAPTVTALTGSSMSVDRAGAPSDNGSPITQYDLRWSYDESTWTTVTNVTDPQTVSSLPTPDADIYVQTRAVNAVGAGPWSTSGMGHLPAAGDVIAPTITSIAYDEPNNEVDISTNEGGTAYYLVNSSSSALSGAVIEAAVTAMTPEAYGSFTATLGANVETPDFSGVPLGVDRYLHLTVKDAAGNYSTDAVDGPFQLQGADTTAPVLSSPLGTQTGQTTADLGVTTDEGNGTIYWVVTQSATQPTATQIKAGQNHTGAAAVDAGTIAVSATGAQTDTASGLVAATTYYAHYIHTDAAANDSNRVTSASFTTAAAPAGPSIVAVDETALSSSAINTVYSAGTYTVSNTANAVLLLVQGCLQTAAAAPTCTITYGSDTVTQVIAPFASGTQRPWAAAYLVANPSAGAQAIGATLSSNQSAINITVVEIANFTSVAYTEVQANATLYTAKSFSRTTGGDNRVLIGAIQVDAGARASEFVADAGTTLEATAQTGTTGTSDLSLAILSKDVPTAGAATLGATWTTSDQMATMLLEIA